jgi:hypothetical protein
VAYDALMDDEIVEITDYGQITIGIKHVEAISPTAEMDALILSWMAEDFFGEEVGKMVYEATKTGGFEVGAKLLLAYTVAVAVDTAIIAGVAGLFIYSTMTAPLFWGGVNAYLTLADKASVPTSLLDVLVGALQLTYGSMDPDERVDMWFNLVKGAIGKPEANLVDSGSLLSWAGIVYSTGTGTLEKITLKMEITTYEKNDNYYMQLNISRNPEADSYYIARFFGVSITTATGWTWYIPSETKSYYVTKKYLEGIVSYKYLAEKGKYLRIEAGEEWNYQIEQEKDWWIGNTTVGANWEVQVYFGPELWRGSAPIYSWTGDASISDGVTETFELPAVSNSIGALSPLNIHVYDQYGRHVGLNSTGGLDVEIPGALYSGPDTFPEIVILSNPELEYRYEMVGTGEGQCKLWFYTPIEVPYMDDVTYEVLMKLGLDNVSISEGQIQSYKYDFEQFGDKFNKLISHGWSMNDAAYYIINSLDTDGDGTPDISDEQPTELFDLTYEITWETNRYNVRTVTNSTVMNFTFNQTLKQVSFDAAGTSGSKAVCNITIPKTLLQGNPWTVTLDGQPTDFTQTENNTHTSLRFVHTLHSMSHIVIQGTWVVPEFPYCLLAFLLLTTLSVLSSGKFRKKQKNGDNQHRSGHVRVHAT